MYKFSLLSLYSRKNIQRNIQRNEGATPVHERNRVLCCCWSQHAVADTVGNFQRVYNIGTVGESVEEDDKLNNTSAPKAALIMGSII
jgi:hypothetical protein